jgi:hypothetical protein
MGERRNEGASMNKGLMLYLKTVLDEAYQSAIKKDPDMSMCNIARALEVLESELDNKKETKETEQ